MTEAPEITTLSVIPEESSQPSFPLSFNHLPESLEPATLSDLPTVDPSETWRREPRHPRVGKRNIGQSDREYSLPPSGSRPIAKVAWDYRISGKNRADGGTAVRNVTGSYLSLALGQSFILKFILLG